MCWLSGSVRHFIESNPAETPFGHPPFVCENPICSHYHADGAEMIKLVDYGCGKAAHFECAYCGLKYKYVKSKRSREKRFIVDYGHLWDSELRRCCQDPKITNEQAAKILKCSETVFLRQKKKRGLSKPVPDYAGMEPEAYYKAKVLEICQEYDEVTIALLDEKVPGAYNYLRNHDNDWIRSKVVFDKERSFRIERENLLLDNFRKIIASFDIEGYPDEQLSYGLIANLIGSTRDELRLYRKRPQSKLCVLLDGLIEHRNTWRQERAAKSVERQSKRTNLLLGRLREIIAAFETDGYPDQQLSYKFIAGLIGSTQYELQYKVSQNAELQTLLNETVEYTGVWRQERIAKAGKGSSKREILLRNAIKEILLNPPEQQISYGYIAKMAGLTKDTLKDNPHLLELAREVSESKKDWIKRRFITAYHSKPIEGRPYSALEICRAASFDRATVKKHRKLFEMTANDLNNGKMTT